MFDDLSEKLQSTLTSVRGRGTLTEADVDAAMREIRLALLEADVNFQVVKRFTATVREQCLGADVLQQLNPGQQVVGIVHKELVRLMGGGEDTASVADLDAPDSAEEDAAAAVAGDGRPASGIRFAPRPPTVVLMAGLQGSGKTTATAKLARLLRERHGSAVGVAACDVYRPAAVDQLRTMGERAGATVYEQGTEADPVDIARWALDRCKQDGKDVLIVDTAGRLHVDDDLMGELSRIRDAVSPDEVLLVVDAMTGQDAVAVAERFADAVQFDGVIMSKLDGDARGGAALSVRAVTGRPIVFASTGEKIEDFERFHPDRMAQRILGMGDVLTLIEQAEAQLDEDEAMELQRKLQRNEFSLEDFLKQMKMVRRMGPMSKVLGMLPGVGQAMKGVDLDDRELDRVEAIILSMTPQERRNPDMVKGSRRTRVATGSGTSVQQVGQLTKNFGEMRKMMRSVSKGKMPAGLEQMLGGGGGGMPGLPTGGGLPPGMGLGGGAGAGGLGGGGEDRPLAGAGAGAGSRSGSRPPRGGKQKRGGKGKKRRR